MLLRFEIAACLWVVMGVVIYLLGKETIDEVMAEEADDEFVARMAVLLMILGWPAVGMGMVKDYFEDRKEE